MAMPAQTIKRYMPKSLLGRAVLILVAPMILLQGVVALVFIQRHYDGVTEQMATAVAQEIAFAIDRIEQAPDFETARTALEQTSRAFDFEMGLVEGQSVGFEAFRSFYDVTGSVIATTLRDEIRRSMVVDLVSFEKHVEAKISTSKGMLRVLIPRRRMNAANPHLLLVWMAVSAAVLTAIAIAFLRNQVRPIRELALSAQAFGRGRSDPFRPSGAEEVRRAGHAFVDMRNRIERHVEQRTRMLSGVSHDLKTPLTRMKLALAVMEPDDETEGLRRDVTEMEHMLAAFLAFARGEGGEASGPASPVELAEEVVADARRKGGQVSLWSEVETPEAPFVDIRRRALKRALTNLVENALIYGEQAQLSVRLVRRYAEFTVEDDGPGIPEERREEALRPFSRLDAARNQDLASGTGLGLSIALDIARSHGGSLKLGQSARLGGLAVTLLVPR